MNISLEDFVIGFQRSVENIPQTLFECKNGHKRKMKWADVLHGHWCAEC
jgi:hypothetical protein